jgi:hypothetical protein
VVTSQPGETWTVSGKPGHHGFGSGRSGDRYVIKLDPVGAGLASCKPSRRIFYAQTVPRTSLGASIDRFIIDPDPVENKFV